jgi:AraC-like DNA-binding protein
MENRELGWNCAESAIAISTHHSYDTLRYSPVVARTHTFRRRVEPVTYDYAQVILVRDGSAVLNSDLGQTPVRSGDVILLGADTSCGSEPEGHVTVTTIYADMDYVIDQFFWQHAGLLKDRLDARAFAATVYTEAAQILRLEKDRAGLLLPWLDELVSLTSRNHLAQDFYRIQALWFNVIHVIAPLIKTSRTHISPCQRDITSPTSPRIRRVAPIRTEARKVAELLRDAPMRRWSLSDLASEVHLSKSQLVRVFVQAFGKSPIAYLTMLRTERMAHLLRSTNTPIAVIAHKVGWGDADFAARQFRRSHGLTPSQYRARSENHHFRASGDRRNTTR